MPGAQWAVVGCGRWAVGGGWETRRRRLPSANRPPIVELGNLVTNQPGSGPAGKKNESCRSYARYYVPYLCA